MTSPIVELTRSVSGALVALPPRKSCAHCGDALRESCAWFGCPFEPDFVPSEDEYERFIEAELARGRP